MRIIRARAPAQMRIDEQKGHQQNGLLTTVVKGLLLPGNLVKVVAASNTTITEFLQNDVSLVIETYERGLALATEHTDGYASVQKPELLLAGSWCLLFGAIISIVLGRTHVLQLFGVSLIGGSVAINGFVPTLQYAIACVATGHDLVIGRKNVAAAPAAPVAKGAKKGKKD